jgi:hypothetical protein
VSRKGTAIVDLVTTQAIRGAEGGDAGQRLLLKALAPIEIGFVAAQFDEEVPDKRRHGRTGLGRPYPSPPVHVIVH